MLACICTVGCMLSAGASSGTRAFLPLWQVIIQEGDPINDSSGFYIIVTGNVEISHVNTNVDTNEEADRHETLAVLQPGEVCGRDRKSTLLTKCVAGGTCAHAPLVDRALLPAAADVVSWLSTISFSLRAAVQSFGNSFFWVATEGCKRSATATAATEVNLVMVTKVRVGRRGCLAVAVEPHFARKNSSAPQRALPRAWLPPTVCVARGFEG